MTNEYFMSKRTSPGKCDHFGSAGPVLIFCKRVTIIIYVAEQWTRETERERERGGGERERKRERARERERTFAEGKSGATSTLYSRLLIPNVSV